MIRLLKEVGHANEAMMEGATVHQIIYDYTKHVTKHGIDYEAMDRIIDQRFDATRLSEEVRASNRLPLLKFAESGINPTSILDFERRFKQDIGNGVRVEGVVDRTNCWRQDTGSVIEIVDYKNIQNVRSKDEVDGDMQLKIYKYVGCTWLYRNYDFVRVGIYHCRFNFIRWTDMIRVDDCAAEFENTDKYLQRQWKRLIETPLEDMKPEKGPACFEYGGCDVAKAGKCPAYSKEAMSKMMIGDMDDMVRAHRKMKHDVEALGKKIREHFKTNAPCVIDGKSVGYAPTISYRYWLVRFYEWAKEKRIDMSGMKISKTDVEKAIKVMFKLDEVEAEIAELREQTATNTMKI
jgi:RecB family exonuclease